MGQMNLYVTDHNDPTRGTEPDNQMYRKANDVKFSASFLVLLVVIGSDVVS